MTKLFNCKAGEQVGKYVAYRAAFVPSLLSFVNTTGSLADAYAALSTTGLVRRASSSELVPGDEVLVVDLLPTFDGQTATIAQLARALDDAADRGSLIPVVDLYSLERIEESDVPGQSGIDARAAYKRAVQGLVEKDSLLPKLTGGLSELKWVLYAVLILALLYLGWKVVAAVKA